VKLRNCPPRLLPAFKRLRSMQAAAFRRFVREKRALGICAHGECANAAKEGAYCAQCRPRYSGESAAYRRRRVEAGLCMRCGKRPLAKRSKSRCNTCLRVARDKSRESAAAKAAK
jgi:hypothetical protein